MRPDFHFRFCWGRDADSPSRRLILVPFCLAGFALGDGHTFGAFGALDRLAVLAAPTLLRHP